MKVINTHKRKINQPIENVSKLFKTLATSEDLIWPTKNWPKMRFKKGLKTGNIGGHGLIKYSIIDFNASKNIKFQFIKPEGFHGFHQLSIKKVDNKTSDIEHIIKMNTTFKATFLWVFVIKWLHDALIEEAFDTIESYFLKNKIETKYNFWVKFLRKIYNTNLTFKF